MALNKYRLGNLIIPYSKKCGIPNLTPYQVSGVNKDKEFFEPSHQVGEDTSKYQVVPPRYFACNLMHVGRDRVLPIAYNHSINEKYVSPAYTVFSLKEGCGVLDDYLFIMLKCEEQDRYFWFHADASVRDGMSWNDFCDVHIFVPDLPIQQKYVDIYKGMVANQQSYERGLEDLKLVCDGYIEDLRRKFGTEPIAPYIMPIDKRNTDLSVKLALGITIDKVFASPKQVAEAEQNAKIVREGQFAYNRATTRNGEKISVAYREGEDCVVSSAYQVFEIKEKENLIPEYLMMWFNRSEFDRYARYMSKGSAHEFFEYSDMEEVEIPIPDIKIQKAIAEIFAVYTTRKQINEQLKLQIKNICPILIRGSLEESSDDISRFKSIHIALYDGG